MMIPPCAHGLLRPLMLALISAGCVSGALAGAPIIADTTLPTGMVLKNGAAELATVGTTMTATQTSARAVWEANNFSIGTLSSFINNGLKGSTTLVRVVSSQGGFGNSSVLNGHLTANNNFILVNPFGIYVGSSAVITGASVVLSALDLKSSLIDNNYQAFMDGQHVVFDVGVGYGGYGESIVEIDQGATLTATDGGSILLIGDNVRNAGALKLSNGGQISLAAVGSATVDIGDSGFITLSAYDQGANPTTRVVLHEGVIDAPNGTVNLVAAGDQSGSNRFFEGVSSPSSNVNLNQSSGVINNGVIKAHSGSARLLAQGVGSYVMNHGLVDVSALSSSTQAGHIRLSAENILLLGDAESPSVLRADGPSGGGLIELNGNTALHDGEPKEGESIQPHWIYGSENSTLSADATETGNGGKIVMATLFDQSANNSEAQARTGFGVLEFYGVAQARGGVKGGNGGTVETLAPAVITRLNVPGVEGGLFKTLLGSIQVNARALGGEGGSWSLYSPDITVGKAIQQGVAGEGSYTPDAPGSYVNEQDVVGVLNSGASVGLTTYNSDAAVVGRNLIVEAGTQIIQTQGAGGNQLVLQSQGDVVVGAGTTIASTQSKLNVTVVADADGNGQGSLIVAGQRLLNVPAILPLTNLRLQAQAVTAASDAPVTIQTHGGDLLLAGAQTTGPDFGAAPANQQAGVHLTGVVLDTRDAASRGDIVIKGAGGATQNGVTIDQADITGRNISILGNSSTATGVRVSNTAIHTDTGTVAITGVAGVGGAVGQAVGVDIGPAVTINMGQGRATILGRARGGLLADAVGLRINGLTVTTSGGGTGVDVQTPLLTLVGQSVESTAPGLQVTAGTPGIALHDEAGPSLASVADVVVGASADALAVQALDLGLGTSLPKWHTSGRLNIRPMGVGEDGQMVNHRDTITRVGADAGGLLTNFIVNPGWFNAAVNPSISTAMGVVIGSSEQTGLISVADGALNGAGAITLQNQGDNAAGIELGEQTSQIRSLSLLTSGKVTQSGAINVDKLNIIATEPALVQLNNAANRIKSLSFSGLASAPVAAQTAATTQSVDGIVAYDSAEGGGFQALSIVMVGESIQRPDTLPPEPNRPPRPFEGPDALSELRTDVYVHGLLSRLQVCTAANTAGGGQGLETNVEPISQEWLKVRRGAQLSNCSGVRADSSCAAF
ncbi:MAG: hypothetical protein Q7U28_04415 [Aquabacterium sp.]|nr:hypothetical protein [Aquabacterium sp.]